MDQITFFDSIAPVWDAQEIRSTPERINHVLDFMDIRHGHSVIDLGTGTGVLLPYLAERVGKDGKITAVDFSHEMLKRAIEKNSGLNPLPHFVEADFENTLFKERFDRIILYSVFPHIENPLMYLRLLHDMNLKDDGIIIIAFPSDEKFINSIHGHREIESEYLKPAPDLAAYFCEHGFDARAEAADADTYVVNIYKRG